MSSDSIVIDGRELHVPMNIADLSLIAQVFSVRTRDVRALLQNTPLRPAELWPGTSAVALLFAQYRDSPLDRYNEAIVGLPAYAPGERALPLLGGLDILIGRAGHYVHAMPVTQSFTMRAGRALWGYPKVLAEIEMALDGDTASASLVQNDQLVFSMRTPLAESGRFAERIANLTWLDGTLRRVSARFEGHGTAFRLGGELPVIGDKHPLALELRALGLPKRPLATVSLRRAGARFEPAQVLAQ
jgi:hypothetical protein